MTRILTNLALKWPFGVITGMTLFTHQAISAPIAGPKGILVAPLDNSQFVQVKELAAAAPRRISSRRRRSSPGSRSSSENHHVYRGGAVVRLGAVAGGSGTIPRLRSLLRKSAEAALVS